MSDILSGEDHLTKSAEVFSQSSESISNEVMMIANNTLKTLLEGHSGLSHGHEDYSAVTDISTEHSVFTNLNLVSILMMNKLAKLTRFFLYMKYSYMQNIINESWFYTVYRNCFSILIFLY